MSEAGGVFNWNSDLVLSEGSFLQSLEWGEFQKSLGRNVFRLSRGGLNAQIIEYALPLGLKYFYIPRAPFAARAPSDGGLKEFFEALFVPAKKQKAIFARVDPLKAGQFMSARQLGNLGFRDMGRAVQAKQNIILDISKPEQEILRGMRHKTRYNIRLAQKHDVKVTIGGVKDSNDFVALLYATQQRQNIRFYGANYYEQMLKTIPVLREVAPAAPLEKLCGRLYFSYYQNKPLAAAFVVYFGRRATYLHGGSLSDNKNVMAPYALHWKIIQDAKTLGFSEYDLGGVDEKKWSGITRFKKGFGGIIEEYPNAFDLTFNRTIYCLYKMARLVFKN